MNCTGGSKPNPSKRVSVQARTARGWSIPAPQAAPWRAPSVQFDAVSLGALAHGTSLTDTLSTLTAAH